MFCFMDALHAFYDPCKKMDWVNIEIKILIAAGHYYLYWGFPLQAHAYDLVITVRF